MTTESEKENETSTEPRQTPTCESGTDAKDMTVEAALAYFNGLLNDRRNYDKALDKIRKEISQWTPTGRVDAISTILESVGK